MENTKNIEAQSALTPPLQAVVVNGKKKVVENGVVELNLPTHVPQQQSDWNQYDENAPDFIKNRPFYSTPTITPIVLEFDENGTLIQNTFEFDAPIITSYINPFVLVSEDETITATLSLSGVPDFSGGGGGGAVYAEGYPSSQGVISCSFSTTSGVWKIIFNVSANPAVLKNQKIIPVILEVKKLSLQNVDISFNSPLVLLNQNQLSIDTSKLYQSTLGFDFAYYALGSGSVSSYVEKYTDCFTFTPQSGVASDWTISYQLMVYRYGSIGLLLNIEYKGDGTWPSGWSKSGYLYPIGDFKLNSTGMTSRHIIVRALGRHLTFDGSTSTTTAIEIGKNFYGSEFLVQPYLNDSGFSLKCRLSLGSSEGDGGQKLRFKMIAPYFFI